ncbi:MAG: hypothetical protein H7A53_02485 [Akkermansiaceae bacterium]|nr:hypothetical protein [Akkermansiaceae bacterium]MCP5549752.1 hypothetical protein [Akkermansiaceae bacterium]
MNDESDHDESRHSYLRRLSPDAYRGHAYVHWSLTIEGRRRSWLTPEFHATFRELLGHTAFRQSVCAPLYCLMPDHLHLLWVGFSESSDQRKAMRFLRARTNKMLLNPGGFEWQKQPYDNVLREKDRNRDAFPSVAAYIRENPLRAGLVDSESKLSNYPYLGCHLPGYPDISIWDRDFWDRFWKIYYERLVTRDEDRL